MNKVRKIESAPKETNPGAVAASALFGLHQIKQRFRAQQCLPVRVTFENLGQQVG